MLAFGSVTAAKGHEIPSSISFQGITCTQQSACNSSSSAPQLQNSNLFSISSSPSSAVKFKPCLNNPIDHRYIAQMLLRKDWFIFLNHEFKAKRITLNAQFVVSVLQNQENQSSSLNFYVWVSNINQSLAKNQSVRGVFGNNLYRKGPVVLSVELLQDIRESGCKLTEDLLCILIGSWGRLGLAKYYTSTST
ncbi:hypothetical protein FNV43_RR00960 [Rhamnella rubrinervis]|uniref:Uncharacterized protein n=1 Tax=Rhamnella rubrinervis TaxID=2594499 RepID=A0A8K0HPL6_9ROSA|nr:hypothetical protein FNV43_RR00960 [Rhamnella rubrinervis]